MESERLERAIPAASWSWRKTLISLAIGAHILAIAWQNLPARMAVGGIYKWYIGLSGQLQGWIMFANLPAESNRIELIARFPDGTTKRPFGPSKEWSAPVLDVVMDAIKSEQMARPFLAAVRATFPPDALPNDLRLSLLYRPLAKPGGDAPGQPAEFAVAKEFSRKW